MTADEIRSKFDSMIAIGPPSTSEARQADIQLMILTEITAQLAELNENLAVFRDVQSSAGHGLCVAPESF